MWSNFFSCYLWWLLAGFLVGWLCNWLLCKCCGRNRSADTVAHTQTTANTTANTATNFKAAAPVSTASTAASTLASGAMSGVSASVTAGAASLAAVIAVDRAAAKAAGIAVRGDDDLEVIEGIGPKICGLFHAAGFKTFTQVSGMTVSQMSAILDAGGPNFRLANPETWAKQAALAAKNQWIELKTMQDQLTAGVDMTADKA